MVVFTTRYVFAFPVTVLSVHYMSVCTLYPFSTVNLHCVILLPAADRLPFSQQYCQQK